MMRRCSALFGAVLLAVLIAATGVRADSKKLTEDQRIELLRGLSAEYATIRTLLPRSKKPLEFNTDGSWDKEKWEMAAKELGPAGRVGDLIQITQVVIDKDRIILVLNNGMRGKGSWKDHVQIGMGTRTSPINGGAPTNAPSGTTIALLFGGPIGEVTSAEIKKMLKPVLDFAKDSVTENYVESLPPEIQTAVRDKRAVVGMNRDQVLLAVGRPLRKSRESKDGAEIEDWIYGEPPGRVTFVTFTGDKVVRVKDTYAGLGGTIAETPGPPQ
jgi:hypothetical protein